MLLPPPAERFGQPHDKECGSSGTDDDSGSASAFSPSGSSNHRPDAGGLASSTGSPRKRSSAVVLESVLDADEAWLPAPTDRREGFPAGRWGSGGSTTPLRATPRRRRQGHTPESVVQVRSRKEDPSSRSSPHSRDPAGKETAQVAAESASRGGRARQHNQIDPKEDVDFSPSSAGDGWERAIAGDDAPGSGRKAMQSSSKGGMDAHGEEEAHPAVAERRTLSPRVVTVSVKPKSKHQRPASASLSEQSNSSTSSQRQQLWPGGDSRGFEGDATFLPGGEGKEKGGDRPETPGSAVPGGNSDAARERKFSTDLVGGDRGPPFRADGDADTVGAAVGAVRTDTSGEKDDGEGATVPAPGHPSLAMELGLEGDGFPDMAEFDLDDISEIDVGGELALSDGDGSLSS